ncbi:MAG: hypothetical protein M1819_000770 [Sarea resinae]|nr:MAG: hypothetical protein M1819_000770 [Sarea resinae]
MPPMSQSAPLPANLPFRIVSKTIGQGAYAFIRKAIPLDKPEPLIAVKFIHKASAIHHGRISAKQIAMEVTLHAHVGRHPNIIELFLFDEDPTWRWLAMELAEGGDLFDKIEADEGVGEDIAHIYFKQLISAVGYMHSKDVAHRDIKPENILLSATGDLKLADFGLAALIRYKGEKKRCTFFCGSPPYIAPEVVTCGSISRREGRGGYAGDMADIWSCGVVLFVLLVGNTPWDQPTQSSAEFDEYVRTNGRTSDEMWQRLPNATLSLLRGMMKIDPETRFTLEDVRRHPWFTRPNAYLDRDGRVSNRISLATKMLESLRIDFNEDLTITPSVWTSEDSMDVDTTDDNSKLSSTQPETPVDDGFFDWERPPHVAVNEGWSASQPTTMDHTRKVEYSDAWERLSEDPSMSQFSATPTVSQSLTQHARMFRDIIPSHSLTRFFSHLNFSLLVPLLAEALQRLGVPASNVSQSSLSGRDETAWIKVKTTDGRHCALSGDIVVDKMLGDIGLMEVRFVKAKGDPLEWRRFFKRVVVLCKEGVYRPGEEI